MKKIVVHRAGLFNPVFSRHFREYPSEEIIASCHKLKRDLKAKKVNWLAVRVIGDYLQSFVSSFGEVDAFLKKLVRSRMRTGEKLSLQEEAVIRRHARLRDNLLPRVTEVLEFLKNRKRN
jgi:hypothetical protein